MQRFIFKSKNKIALASGIFPICGISAYWKNVVRNG